nr:ZRK [Liriodendron chinense]
MALGRKPVEDFQLLYGFRVIISERDGYSSWFGFGLGRKRPDEFLLNNGAELLEELITFSEGKSTPIRIFSAQELEKATKNYSDLLFDKDPWCKMYKGTIDGRAIVVSKEERFGSHDCSKACEVAMLSRINHVNIVKIIGCCLEIKIPTLVYEFFSHETLYARISEAGTSCYISWDNCLKIATGVAYGLTYLHINMVTPIVHRDLKSSNILLDEHCNVKIIGFDLSLSMPLGETEIESSVAGTLEYLDPHYALRGLVSEKIDVFSYGVIMFEILTGETASKRDPSKAHIWFTECMEANHLGFVEASVLKEAKKDQLVAFVELARRCVVVRWQERPTMMEVVKELRRIKGL